MKFLISLIFLLAVTTAKAEKFINQTDTYSCGPVALYNALVWKGRPIPLKTISEYTETTPPNGTFVSDLLDAAFMLDLDLERVDKKDINPYGMYILRIVAPKNGSFKETGGHFIFMADGYVYNLTKTELATPVTSIIIQAFLYEDGENKPIVWKILN